MRVSDWEYNKWKCMLDTSTNLTLARVDQLTVDTAFLLTVKNHHLCNYQSLYLKFTDYVESLEELKIKLSSKCKELKFESTNFEAFKSVEEIEDNRHFDVVTNLFQDNKQLELISLIIAKAFSKFNMAIKIFSIGINFIACKI